MLQNVEEYPELKHPRFDHGRAVSTPSSGPAAQSAETIEAWPKWDASNSVCVCVDFSGLYKQLTSAIPFYQQGLPDNVAEHVNAGALG